LLTDNADALLPASESHREHYFAGEVNDDLLRMLFVCCDPAIAPHSQLVLALKTLCGFSVQEIAQRLFISTANTYKMLSRARDRLRETSASFDERGSVLDESTGVTDSARL